MIGRAMSEDDYQRLAGCRASYVKALWNATPAHFVARSINADSDALRIGRAFHCRLLRPDDFAAEFVVSPKFDRRTKAGKADAEAFAADAGGRGIVDADEMESIDAMATAVWESTTARGLLRLADSFETVVSADIDGVPCKAKLDAVGDFALVDVKTTVSAAPRAFARSCAEYLYHVQFAFYRAILRANGHDPGCMAIIAVEKARPHCVASYVLNPADIDAVEADALELARLWRDCSVAGRWPGYADEVVELAMPAWALRRSTTLDA